MAKRKPAHYAPAPKQAAPLASSLPTLYRDPNSYVGMLWLIVCPTFCGYEAVGRRVYTPGVNFPVCNRIITEWELERWTPVPWTEETSLQSFLEGLRTEAAANGAEAGAVQLLRDLIPFSEKELNIMADKLKTKGTTKPAAKKDAKAPAKGKGGGAGAAKLKEASAARTSANHAKKIKLLIKPDAAGLRGGRLAKLQAVADNKPATVGDIIGTVVKDENGKEHKIDMGSLTGMVKRGHIAIA